LIGGHSYRTAIDDVTAAVMEPGAAEVLRDLLALGVLQPGEEYGLTILETSISHRSFRVRRGASPGLFVKKADLTRSHGRGLATEAAVYRLARTSKLLDLVVPPCRAVSPDDSLVVLEEVPGTPLSETGFARGEPVSRDHKILCRYGRATARVHQVRPHPLGEPPWLLTALEPGWGTYPWLPEPCRHLLMRLASVPLFRQGFARAASTWRSASLVHGDLRWANVLAMLDDEPQRLWLVDWELACLGDPAWDLGSVLADLLAAAAVRWLEDGELPDVWPGARAFFASYRHVAPSADVEWLELVRRSVALTGVRLIQTLVEYGYFDMGYLAAAEPLLLPWAAALLQCPDEIVSELVGPHARPCQCGQ
jgi:hypothetical protein